MVPTTPQEICTYPCDMVEIWPTSRKAQEEGRVRPIVGRMNTQKLQDPHRGLDRNPKGDIATIMQAWYIQTGVMMLNEEERQQRPVIANADGKMISTERVLMLLRQMAEIDV